MRILCAALLIVSAVITAGCGKKDLKDMSFSGTLEMTEHVLGARVAGRVATVTVKEGDTVKAGQVLATLDRYEQTQKDFERVQELFKTGGANAQEVEHAQLAVDDQRVVSPVDGIVLVKAAETGETLSSGAGVLVVGDTKDQWVKIFVPEGMINRLTMDQGVVISLDGTDKTYKGHVSFIAAKAEFTPRNIQTPEERVTQDFAVKASLDQPDASLHTGVAADVRLNP